MARVVPSEIAQYLENEFGSAKLNDLATIQQKVGAIAGFCELYAQLPHELMRLAPQQYANLVPPSGSRDSGLREGTQANVEDQDRAVHHLFQRHHGQALPLDLRREASRRIA
jgi:hypothetical protein